MSELTDRPSTPKTPRKPKGALARRVRNDASFAAEALTYASLSLVPIVGGTVTTLMGAYGSRLVQRRIDNLAEELEATTKKVESKVDREFLETDEWADLVLRVVRDSLQTSDRKKVRYLAAILAGSATTDRIDPSETEAILNALAELTAVDMELARAIVYRRTNPPDAMTGDSLPVVGSNPQFHAARLQSAGFIQRSGGQPGMRPQPAPFEAAPILHQLMKMIGPILGDEV